MAVNVRAADKILRGWTNGGIYISLHSGEPGSSGSPALFGPALVSQGALRTSNGEITNTQLLTLGESSKGGRATHVGVWINRSTFLGSSKLSSPIVVAVGSIIQIPRYSLKVRFGN